MSFVKTIGDYLRVIKAGVQNGDKIVEALRTAAEIKNETGDISDEAVAEIMRRKDICAGCIFYSENAKNDPGYKHLVPNVDYKCCILCLCRIGYDDSKEYCLSCKCGAASWNERFPDMKPLEVKWGPFEINTEKN